MAVDNPYSGKAAARRRGVRMPGVKEIQIRCGHCKKWFNSPIGFSGTEAFDSATLIGNIVQCPSCGQMTSCNKENMRVHFEGGGFLGKGTT
jgi:hypothetical protein